MADPKMAQKAPYAYTPEKDEKVAWCACGLSESQPFCDGSHRGSEFRPIVLDVQAGKTCFFCGCKQTGKAPMCDGTHSMLWGEASESLLNMRV